MLTQDGLLLPFLLLLLLHARSRGVWIVSRGREEAERGNEGENVGRREGKEAWEELRGGEERTLYRNMLGFLSFVN